MEFVNVLTLLARRPVAVAFGALVALVAGLVVMGRLPLGPAAPSTQHKVIAESRLLVDAPASVIGDLRITAEAIGTQAAMLAGSIADDGVRAQIARRAAVPVGQLEVLEAAASPPVPGPLATAVAIATAKATLPYVLTSRVDPSVQIITLDAAAPTSAGATALVRAASDTLATRSRQIAPRPARALVIKPLGAVRTAPLESGGRSAFVGLLAALVVFALWCGTVVIGVGAARGWRSVVVPPAV